MDDTPEKSAQIRLHWLAASRYSRGTEEIKRMLAAQADAASALFYGLVSLTSQDFLGDGGSVYDPAAQTFAGIRSSYTVQCDEGSVRVTVDDIRKCAEMVLCAVTGTQATGVSVFAAADPEGDPKELLQQLRDASDVGTWGVVGKLDKNVRKFAWLVLVSAELLPDMSEIPSSARRSVLANVQGKYKSLLECAKSHRALYNQHQKRKDALLKAVDDAGFHSLCSDLLNGVEMRSVDSKRMQTIEELMRFVIEGRDYVDYKATKTTPGWEPPESMFDVFSKHKEAVARNISEGAVRNVAFDHDGEDVEVPVFELLNEMRWLSTHSHGIRRPSFPKHAYGLKLGNNYLKIAGIEILQSGLCGVARVTFNVNKVGIVCDFVLGKDSEYWNNLKITESENDGIFNVIKTVRRFTSTGPKLVEIKGVLKEPEIRFQNGVLGLRMPISFEVDLAVGENSVALGRKLISLKTTPFAKKDKFTDLIGYRNSQARDGYIYYAGMDQGETDQVIGIYRTKMYKDDSLPAFFDAAESLEVVAHARFSLYQENKRALCHPKSGVLPVDPIYKLARRIKLLRGLVQTLRAYTRNADYYVKLKDRRRCEWRDLAMGTLDFDEAMEAAEFLFDNSNDPEFKDVVSNPSYIVNVLDADIYSQFKQLRDDRSTKYVSQHQHDYQWIETVDFMISLRKSLHQFGKPPEPVWSVRDPYPANLVSYRANLMKQYRKEVAAFVRDTCLEYGVRMLAVEELKPNPYVNDDSDTNRKRALFSPVELHADIRLACALHEISVVEIDETLTSRVAPNGQIGFRSNVELRKFHAGADGKFNWKRLHYVHKDALRYIDADENACRNITMRAVTCGASKPCFSKAALIASKKGPVLTAQLAWLLYKRGAGYLGDEIVSAGLAAVLSDLGGTFPPGKGRIYLDSGKCVSAETRKVSVSGIAKTAAEMFAEIPY